MIRFQTTFLLSLNHMSLNHMSLNHMSLNHNRQAFIVD